MEKKIIDWMVVGAGPGGIAAVGKLLDGGIDPKKMGWIDPHFSVGDLGARWNRVPSNTSVGLFLRFLNDCKAFEFGKKSETFHLETLDPKENCQLQHIVDPLQWITNHLKKKIAPFTETVLSLTLSQGCWHLKTKTGVFQARNVILAIGSEPKKLSYPSHESIELDVALHPEKLERVVHPADSIAVFGSSHSGILALANLSKLKVKQVIHFYRSPHKYAVYFPDWILFDDTGLKGYAAKWAKAHLDGTLPPHFQRVNVADRGFEESMALCNKAIYAVGFERRKLPILEQYEKLRYDDRTGIIAPGLFGLGIAFPQAQFNRLGQLEHRVGLWKFMDYLNSVLPIWFEYRNVVK